MANPEIGHALVRLLAIVHTTVVYIYIYMYASENI